jgi:hypothetical protein
MVRIGTGPDAKNLDLFSLLMYPCSRREGPDGDSIPIRLRILKLRREPVCTKIPLPMSIFLPASIKKNCVT